MKKTLYLSVAIIICITVLSGCAKAESKTTWLQGNWYSKAWQVTYVFSQKNNNWQIKDVKGNVISESATPSKDSDDKTFTLVDKNGTKYVISKIDNETMKFYQTGKKGLMGTTAAVDFVKQ
ncbi:MAG: aldo/keto reductase [Lactococcus plantarum]|nr:aldo/keto reductase [Lactococcus plantarum]MDN6085046.1 aldo/keto reductase [Lactococcus plantarum]